MFEKIELFGSKINIRNYFCSTNPNKFKEGNLKLNLYIKITDSCNAKCQFCSNKEMQDYGQLDLDKLKYVITHLKEKDMLNRIAITGGEPLLNLPLLNKVLNLIFDILPKAFVTLNTNGYNLRQVVELGCINKLEGIHISRHHYDDTINNEIFGINVARTEDIKFVMDKVENKKLIRLNCLLMRDYISSSEEVKEYLEYASKLNIFRVGFVALMKTNDFSKEQFVSFDDVFKNLPNEFFSSGRYYDRKICECINGLYIAKNGNLIEYYSRMTKELNCDYSRQLVYTSDNRLTMGFGKKSLI